LEALKFLHGRSVMHRNLKPENVLVDKCGSGGDIHVKVSDLSMSRSISFPNMQSYTPEDPKDRDRSGREARRLWYRAPEFFFRQLVYGQEVDMWTVGCLLAEMARGDPLFVAESEIE
jgi:serine/threonine protein kinase